VAAGEGDPRDQVMEHELVQDDDSVSPLECLHDPPVLDRVVADVVQVDVRLRRPAEPAGAGDDYVHPFSERRQEQRRVVGDPRPRRRQRRVVGDPHQLSSLSIVVSQVTRSAISLPARPQAAASSPFSRAKAAATDSARGSATSPVAPSVTISSGPPASVVVTTGFPARNASYGTIPKSSSTGA